MGDLKKVSGFGLSAEYLKSAMQDYDLWKAPLEHLCRKSADLGVGQIVSSPLEGESIDSDASLNQAVHQMIMGHHQSLLITFKGEIVGILRLTDVFDEVGKRMKACRI
jgi:predicted transcriptional regulator